MKLLKSTFPTAIMSAILMVTSALAQPDPKRPNGRNERSSDDSKPYLEVDGKKISPIAGPSEDVILKLCNGPQVWKLHREFTIWSDVNRFGIYTDPGVGQMQSLLFSGSDGIGTLTQTNISPGDSIGLWLLNDINNDSVFNADDAWLFSERSLTVNAGDPEHQWFMVFDVSSYKGLDVEYEFETPGKDYEFRGDFDYLIFVDDDRTSTKFDHDDMIISVACGGDSGPNRPPVAVCPGDTALLVCRDLTICLPGFAFSDPDNNIASVEVVGGILDANSVCFTPLSGQNKITLIVTDQARLVDSCSTIANVIFNRTPTVTISRDFSFSLCEPQQLCLPVTIEDPDGNLVSVTSNIGTVDLTSGELCFTPDAAGVAHYDITITATDNCGEVASATTSVQVSLGMPELKDQTFVEAVCSLNDERILPPLVSTTDSDIRFSLLLGPGSIDSLTGSITYLPDTSGQFEFTVEGRSACGVDTALIRDIVTQNLPPQLFAFDTTIVLCAVEEICLPIEASDPEGEAIVISQLEGLGIFEQLTDSTATTCFTPADVDTATYQFVYRAVDSCLLVNGGQDAETAPVCCFDTISVTVIINGPPRIVCPPDGLRLRRCEPGQFCFDVELANPVSDNITLSLISGDAVLNGRTVCFGESQFPTRTLVFEATNSCGVDTCSMLVTAIVNNPPVMEDQSFSGLFVPKPRQLQIVATDPDNDLLTFSLVSGAGSIDANTGVLTYTPDSIRTYTFVVEVSDSCSQARATITDILGEKFELTFVAESFKPDSVYAFGSSFDITFDVKTSRQSPRIDSTLATITLLDSMGAAEQHVLVLDRPATVTIDGDVVSYVIRNVSPRVARSGLPPGNYLVKLDLKIFSGPVISNLDNPFVDSLNVLPYADLQYVSGSLSPMEVAAGGQTRFTFDLELLDPTVLGVLDNSPQFFLYSRGFSIRSVLEIANDRIESGTNSLQIGYVFIPAELLGDSLQLTVSFSYSTPGVANFAAFRSDLDRVSIPVVDLPLVQILEVSNGAFNSPNVNTNQTFTIDCRIASHSGAATPPFELTMASDGSSMFNSLITVPPILPFDTVTVSFDVTAGRVPNSVELFHVDVVTNGVGEVPPQDHIAAAVVQTPASLSLSSTLIGVETGVLGVGQPFALIVRLKNEGQASVSEGAFEFTSHGIDLGMPDPVVGRVRPDTAINFHMIAPSFDTTLQLSFSFTELPVDLNTGLPVSVVPERLDRSVMVLSRDGILMVSAELLGPNLVVPDRVQSLFELELSNRSSSPFATVDLNEIELRVTGSLGEEVNIPGLIDMAVTGFSEDGRLLTGAFVTRNRLRLRFTNFVLAPSTTRKLILELSPRTAIGESFSLSLDVSFIKAAFAEGPLAGQPVRSVTGDGEVSLINQNYVTIGADLQSSFEIEYNPFNPLERTARFAYFLSEAGGIEFRVYSLAGEEVFARDLPTGSAGTEPNFRHLISWNGHNNQGGMVINGVYIAVIRQKSTGSQATIKVAVLK